MLNMEILVSNLEGARSTALSPANWARGNSSTLGNPTSPTPEEVALKRRLHHPSPDSEKLSPSIFKNLLPGQVCCHTHLIPILGRQSQTGRSLSLRAACLRSEFLDSQDYIEKTCLKQTNK